MGSVSYRLPNRAIAPDRRDSSYASRSYAARSMLWDMSDEPRPGGSGSGRPNEPGILILTSLASGPKHGHALAKDIDGFAGVRLGPGSLYGAITRLEQRGFIEPLATDARRRPYRLTPAGRRALGAAVDDMRRLVDTGEERLGLAPRSRSGGRIAHSRERFA